MDNRRLLMATLLSAAILILWTVAFPPPPAPEPIAETAAASAPGSPAGAPGSSPAANPTAEASTTAGASSAEVARGLSFGEGEISAAEEKTVVLENERVRIEIRNRGAQVVSARLKTHLNAKKEPLELVRSRGTDPYPLAILGEDGRSKALNEALFVIEERNEGDVKVATLRHQSEKGVAEKTFRLDQNGFLEVAIRTGGLGQWGLLLGPGVEDTIDTSSTAIHSVGIRRGEEDEEIDAKGTRETLRVDIGTASWISLEDNFFFTAFIPEQGFTAATLRPVWVRSEIEPGQPRFLAAETNEKGLVQEMLVIAEANRDAVEGKLYFGAKQYSDLQALPHDLEHTVRWGMLFFLAKPLYHTLEWIHDNVVPNYGWAIVIVTFLIKLAFFPLTWKGTKAMAKTQELNPKVQAIRTKYRPKLKNKDGKPNFEAQRQMNDEVMALYRQAGVNPVSGCLPLLLQMPVFFAFYKLLTLAVELRQAPWILWIQDLSVHDPYYVLPILMGVTSVLLQRMSPAPPDPVQAKLLQIMPIVFTVFAFAFPSGLVIYWLTNNLLTMVQQALILKGNKATAPKAA